jgi:hypothetical protein
MWCKFTDDSEERIVSITRIEIKNKQPRNRANGLALCCLSCAVAWFPLRDPE